MSRPEEPSLFDIVENQYLVDRSENQWNWSLSLQLPSYKYNYFLEAKEKQIKRTNLIQDLSF